MLRECVSSLLKFNHMKCLTLDEHRGYTVHCFSVSSHIYLSVGMGYDWLEWRAHFIAGVPPLLVYLFYGVGTNQVDSSRLPRSVCCRKHLGSWAEPPESGCVRVKLKKKCSILKIDFFQKIVYMWIFITWQPHHYWHFGLKILCCGWLPSALWEIEQYPWSLPTRYEKYILLPLLTWQTPPDIAKCPLCWGLSHLWLRTTGLGMAQRLR